MKCAVCDRENPSWSWTDSHGIAQCWDCGTPYRLIHYDGNKRVEREPECVVADEWLPRLREYREQVGGIIPSGCSFPGGQERATQDDIRKWNEWVDTHYPQEASA